MFKVSLSKVVDVVVVVEVVVVVLEVVVVVLELVVVVVVVLEVGVVVVEVVVLFWTVFTGLPSTETLMVPSSLLKLTQVWTHCLISNSNSFIFIQFE